MPIANMLADCVYSIIF